MRDNLILRGNTYHVRLALPADVRPFFGNRKLLSQSLKTGLQQEAKDRARPILLDWKDQIAKAKQAHASQAEQWREELAKVGTLSQRSLTRKVMKAVQGKPSLLESKGAEYVDGVLEAIKSVHDQMAEGLREDGVPDELLDRIFKNIRTELTTSGLESIPTIQSTSTLLNEARLQAASNRYRLTSSQQAEASTILANPKAYKPKSPITRTMLDSWVTHLESQIPTAKTRDRHKASILRFSNYLSREGLPLNFDTVHAFLSTLPEARQTRSNYLWSGRTFWKWANKYQPAFRDQFSKQPCPFDGHELPRTGEAAGRKRKAFSKQEIEALHRKSVEKGSTALAQLIQFAAYTGARLEEIGRIKPEHTIFDSSGEPVGFKITESKTEAGVRDIPLHPALVHLFRELSAKASENDGYLFPGGQNKYGNRLDGLSKQFGRLKSKDFGKDHTFHSIRHSVTTLLHQEGVSIEVLPYILGHETGAFSLAQYSKGPSFEQKAQAIALLEYNF
ncbi:tyrosine-type recombinase/integrase [Pseudomonas sp. XK-1]|uniref:tyrosine-type recombinase/integrase n=1 Tax=Pseudomonas sp. XK-1 TaxID=3136019 RepID=UPI00311A63AE